MPSNFSCFQIIRRLDARLGKMLVLGALLQCVNPVLTVCAALTGKSPFLTRKRAPSRNDNDGDGLTNLSEYLAGTDPSNAASALRLTTVNLINSKISLFFEASQGRLIEIQSTPLLRRAAWKSVLEVDVKSDGSQQVEVDLPAGEAHFFRLLLVE